MESHRDDAEQEIRNFSCINFTANTAEAVFVLKLSLSSLAIVANLVVIILIILTKKAKTFMMYRLLLYLMIIDIFQAIDIIFIVLPITVPSDEDSAIIKPGWSKACIASGFFSVMTLWMGNIIIFWIVVYLAWIGYCLYRRTQNHHINDFPRRHPRMFEGACVIFLLVLVPVIIAVIPFIRNMYGLAGLWCWIKIMNHVCGDLGGLPLTLDLTLFYAPLLVIFMFTTVASCFAVICCCRGGVRRHDAIVSLRKSNMKDIIIVLMIPLVYCVLCLLLLINRIHSATHENVKLTGYPYIPLWITHAVADPVRLILPALTYLLNPLVWSDILHVCTCTPTQDSLQPLHSLKEGSNKDYGTCDDSTIEDDDDVTDDEYVRSLLKVKRKT